MLRRKPTILCIDDEWNQLTGYKALLEDTGYKLGSANTFLKQQSYAQEVDMHN